MKIGVVGAGMTGLTAAYELSKAGMEVVVFESSKDIGGIAGVMEHDSVPIEKYYHHFFKSDMYIAKLLKELGLERDVKWLEGRMGFFIDDLLYDFGTPISLLKFKPLSLLDKARFGMTILKILGLKNYKKLENITAHQWLIQNAGAGVYNKVWKPLLVSKFGSQYKDISMSWFWGKIKLRGTSKEKGKEVLGYIEGSNKRLLDNLKTELSNRGVEIKLNCSVNSAAKDDTFRLSTSCGDYVFDRVLFTVQLPAFLDISTNILPASYLKEKRNIEYTGVVCMMLMLDRQFTKYYWLNMGDETIPFGGLIEHTNMLDSKLYKGSHILYISNYVYTDSPYYKMNPDELLDDYSNYLKKINPQFNVSWVKDLYVFKDDYAQPVIKNGFSEIKPQFTTPVEGLYTASMCNIYPEDRGMNYAVRDGMAVSKVILMGEK